MKKHSEYKKATVEIKKKKNIYIYKVEGLRTYTEIYLNLLPY